MSSSLHQLRLQSSRECSTSYAQPARLCRSCAASASRRARRHQRPSIAVHAGKATGALSSSPNDDGLPERGPQPGEPPPVEGNPSTQPIEQQPAKPKETGLPQVPWGLDKVFQVMTLWLLAYFVIGQIAVPVTLELLGLHRPDMSVRGNAVLHLCLDLSQLAVTLGILWSCLRGYKPRQRGLFPVRLKGYWILAVALCCATFPAVDWLAHQNAGWFPSELDATWANNLEQSLSVGDWVTNAAYVSVVSLCAPIWEEAIFRGFLLPSLARYMPAPAAVLASSVVFAMCHFRLQIFFPLLALGVVFSLVFMRTNNLIPPILLHSAWNMYVLVNLVLRPG